MGHPGIMDGWRHNSVQGRGIYCAKGHCTAYTARMMAESTKAAASNHVPFGIGGRPARG